MSEPAPETPFVSLDELTTHLTAAAVGDEQEQLQDHLDATLEWVAERVGPLTGVAQEYAVFADGRHLVLPATHLVTIVSVTDPNGRDVTPRMVDRLAGIVHVSLAVPGEWTVTASTRAHGKAVRLAVLIIASHLWETKRGRGAGGPRAAMMATGIEPASSGSGYAIPHRAADLLRPFLRGST